MAEDGFAERRCLRCNEAIPLGSFDCPKCGATWESEISVAGGADGKKSSKGLWILLACVAALAIWAYGSQGGGSSGGGGWAGGDLSEEHYFVLNYDNQSGEPLTAIVSAAHHSEWPIKRSDTCKAMCWDWRIKCNGPEQDPFAIRLRFVDGQQAAFIRADGVPCDGKPILLTITPSFRVSLG